MVRASTSAREIRSSPSGNPGCLERGSLILKNLPSSDQVRFGDCTAFEHTLLVTGVNLGQYGPIR